MSNDKYDRMFMFVVVWYIVIAIVFVIAMIDLCFCNP